MGEVNVRSTIPDALASVVAIPFLLSLHQTEHVISNRSWSQPYREQRSGEIRLSTDAVSQPRRLYSCYRPKLATLAWGNAPGPHVPLSERAEGPR
jgi:hypothetical protein